MKPRKKNYNILSSYNYYTPGPKGMFGLLLWLLVGTLLGVVITSVFTILMGLDSGSEFATLISYPVMFIPAMIYAAYKSRTNSFFETGYKIDNNHYGKTGGFLFAIIVVIATLAAGFVIDLPSSFMPEMPESLQEALKTMTEGNLFVNIICTAVFAAFFEEWLCRGMVLRGLLNYKKKDGSRGMKPVWAIVVSAVFFAAIHANPWQALPAFLIGCVMGYIYYKTGSLKLTMLMHFTNNLFAVLLSRVESLKEMNYWRDVMDPLPYAIIYIACVLLIILAFRRFQAIDSEERGNCDEVTIPIEE